MEEKRKTYGGKMSDLIMGKNTIFEVLKHKPNIIAQIFTAKDLKDPHILDLQKNHIPIKFVSKKTLSQMVKSESHQNLVAKIKSRNYWNLKDFLKSIENKKRALVLMLDSIFDPQNFGAILRGAECFSVDGVIFSKNRGSDITVVVTKAAAGASEMLNLIKVSNLANSLDHFIDSGFSIVATTLEKSSKELYSFKFSDKTLLIMGSEGLGVQKILLKKANSKIHIPMSGNLQSLNVSMASAIILSYFRFGAK